MEEMKPWEHALQELRPTLAEAIDAKSSPDRFGDALVGKNFITEQAKRDRVNDGGCNYNKITKLLDAVSTDIKYADNKDERFKDFTEILRNLGLCDIERKLTECYRKLPWLLFCQSQILILSLSLSLSLTHTHIQNGTYVCT